MFSLQLKIFLVLSLALHAALVGLFAYLGPKKVDTPAQILPVGFVTQQKDPGIRKGSSPEPPKKAEPEPQRKAEAEPEPVKKPVKKVVRKKPQKKAPEKKEVITTVRKETPAETTPEISGINESGRSEEVALRPSLRDSGSGDRGSGLDTSGTGEGAETVGYPDYGINPKPEYPRIAKRYGYEGLVILNVYVLESGRVGKIELRKSSGYDVLDNSALDAVKGWIFVPGKRNGEPTPSWVVVPIRFDLTSG